MSIKLTKCSLMAMVLVALVSAPRAQEAAGASDPTGGSDKERLERAKQEQAEAKKEADASAEAEAKAAEEAATAKNLEDMGVDAADMPPEESKGFFVAVEALSAEVSGGDRTIARVGSISTSATTAETLDTDVPGSGTPGEGLPDAYTMTGQAPLSLVYDAQFSPVIEAGYRRAKGGVFSVRYFAWSADASVAANSSTTFPSADPLLGNLVLGGIDNQGMEATSANVAREPEAFARPFGSPREIVGSGLHGADSVSAQGSLELSRIDLMFSRTMLARKRLELNYRVGLSLADATRTESARFTWRSFDRSRVQANALSVEDVSASCDTSGLGAMAGIAGRLGLTENRRWSVRLGMELAGLTVTKDLRFRDVQQYSQDNLPTPALEVFQDSHDSSDDFVTILDLDVALEYRFAQRVRVGLGYRQATYYSMLTEERYPSSANIALLESRAVDLDVGGPYLRVGFFF